MIEARVQREADVVVNLHLQREFNEFLWNVPSHFASYFEGEKFDNGENAAVLDNANRLLNFADPPSAFRDLTAVYIMTRMGMVTDQDNFVAIDDLYFLPEALDNGREDGGIFGENAAQTMVDVLNLRHSSHYPHKEAEERLWKETEERYGVTIELQEERYALVG